MFEVVEGGEPGTPAVTTGELAATRTRITTSNTDQLSDAERVDLLAELERLACAAAGLQTVLAADLATNATTTGSATSAQGDSDRDARRARAVASQVGLARRVSLHRATSMVKTATRIRGEMPHTLAALRAGELSEYRAMLIARETEALTVDDRQVVDAELCADPSRFTGWGDQRVQDQARKVAYRLEPAAAVKRASNAESDRHVSIRPAPDTMTRLTALLPVCEGVAVYAALHHAAEAARCAGDGRTRGQVMADELVTRTTGRPIAATSDATPTGAEDIESSITPTTPGVTGAADGAAGTATDVATADGVTAGADPDSADPDSAGTDQAGTTPAGPGTKLVLNLVMTDRTLLACDDVPAHVDGYGTVPAAWARQKLLEYLGAAAVDPDTEVTIRRLFTTPETGTLIAMDSKARTAPPGLADLIRFRDRTCRMPFCDAPIRHIDHLTRHDDGGHTAEANLAGLCEAHNYVHEHPDWHHHPPPDEHDERHTFTITTPTGHVYESAAPAPPGTSWRPGASGLRCF